MSEDRTKPNTDFTDEEAATFIGKTVLIGITNCDIEGKEVSLKRQAKPHVATSGI